VASLRGKFGFTGWLNNTMLYATGGVAWEKTEFAAQLAQTPPQFASVNVSNTSFNTTKSGWVVGGGAEWMATPQHPAPSRVSLLQLQQ
jgi:outer membrane immunogenic protein